MRRMRRGSPGGVATALLALAAWTPAACSGGAPTGGHDDPFFAARELMVRNDIEGRGLRDPEVLGAMRRVPRHLFVSESLRSQAYSDRPLPIGEGQTISQPFVVALMSSLAGIEPGLRVLEIGTGSGYQAAVLAELGAEVWSIELLPAMGALAAANLAGAGYDGLHLRVGDGYLGWPEEAPFDRIVITAAPPEIPPALIEQLGRGGRLVAPVGDDPRNQRLVVATRNEDGEVETTDHGGVAFVPMVPGEERPD